MGPLPSGTVTVLFTDIEGSTRLWEERREDMPSLLARHDDALRAAVECRGGHVVKSTGDGMIAVFAGAAAAVDAATEAKATLGNEALPPVRMAVHTGVERLEAEAERMDVSEALDMAITWIDQELARPERDPGTR